MVSTRSHPQGDFPAMEPSPTKKAPRSRTSTASPAPTSSPELNSSPTAKSLARRAVSNATADVAPPSPSEIDEPVWCHTASNLTILWLTVSIPLVLWDTLYILLRPHTMEGGAIHWPIWQPYEIYAAIDHVYGWPGWENQDGFGGAQGALNAVELVMYGLYAMIIYNHGVPTTRATGLQVGEGVNKWLAGGRKVRGRTGNRALVIGFAAAVMTLSKTVLYYFNEYFSGFASVGHNDWAKLLFFYIIINGLWVAFPAYMTVVFGTDILQGLDTAAESSSKKRS
ncbi:hypothetical protein BDW02DRAFT_190666 [Decorospora gaudefroyi]|uniref:Uncharacterized protein n=1 Tax=Decorospora gaudefroyi TaxID=184978 RepID=A0A6A5K410_9PLEO|nr:hypothetical protein BDW02DRAFT_190666 [Decorospora gaudefroyi]